MLSRRVHRCMRSSAALSDAHERAHTFTAPSASLPDAGCPPALACHEMLAVLPFSTSKGSVPDELGALLSRHSESAVWVAGIALLAPPLARARHPLLCSVVFFVSFLLLLLLLLFCFVSILFKLFFCSCSLVFISL